jgi:hypothetical protein
VTSTLPRAAVDDALFRALDAAVTGRARGAAPSSTTDATLDAAARARLQGLALRGLRRLGAASLPPRRAAELGGALQLERERAQLTSALEARGVDVLVLKGALHDPLLYGARGERGATDLDLLVRRAQEPDASAVLREARYARVRFETHLASDDASKERMWARPDAAGRRVVDLHVGLLNAPPFTVDEDALFSRAVTHDTPLGPIRGLHVDDLVAHLAGNLGQDRFRARLPLAVDAAAALGQLPVDLDEVVARARAWGCGWALWALLRLVDARFDVPIPDEILRAVAPPRALRPVLERIAGVRAPPPPARTRGLRPIVTREWPLSGQRAWPVRASARWARLRALDVARAQLERRQPALATLIFSTSSGTALKRSATRP